MLVILISLKHGMVFKKSICLQLTKEVNKVFQIDAKEGLPPFPLPEAPWYSWRASSVVITCRSHFDHVFNKFLALDFRLCLLLGFQKAKLQDDFKKHKIAFYKHTSVVLNLFRVTKILDPLLEKKYKQYNVSRDLCRTIWLYVSKASNTFIPSDYKMSELGIYAREIFLITEDYA